MLTVEREVKGTNWSENIYMREDRGRYVCVLVCVCLCVRERERETSVRGKGRVELNSIMDNSRFGHKVFLSIKVL